MAMSEQTPLEFEREKWRGEYELRKREIEIKEREASRSRWSSPVVVALLVAATAGLGNAAAIWLNGWEQRKLETTRAMQTKDIEETKAEAARILEAIRTDDPDKAAVNLKFLLEAGLLVAERRQNIQAFLDERIAGQGPWLPASRVVLIPEKDEPSKGNIPAPAATIPHLPPAGSFPVVPVAPVEWHPKGNTPGITLTPSTIPHHPPAGSVPVVPVFPGSP
jgi:hypothetical protein